MSMPTIDDIFNFFSPPPPPPPSMFLPSTATLIWLSGWMGFVLSLVLTQLPSAKMIALTQAVTNATYALHFVLLGARGGVASQMVGMLNGLLKYNNDTEMCKKAQAWLPVTLLPLAAVTCRKPLDVLPLLAIGGRMLAFRVPDEFTMRILLPLALMPWVPYSLAVGSFSSLVSCLLSMALGGVALYRFHKSEVKAFAKKALKKLKTFKLNQLAALLPAKLFKPKPAAAAAAAAAATTGARTPSARARTPSKRVSATPKATPMRAEKSPTPAKKATTRGTTPRSKRKGA